MSNDEDEDDTTEPSDDTPQPSTAAAFTVLSLGMRVARVRVGEALVYRVRADWIEGHVDGASFEDAYFEAILRRPR